MAKKKAEVVEEKVEETKKTTGKKGSAKNVEEKAAPKGKGKDKGKEKGKGAAKAPGKRGRIAGVRNVVKDEYETNIKEQEDQIADSCGELSKNIFRFLDTGNKSAAGKARADLMTIIKVCKEMRKEIQSAKNDMDQVPIDK